MSIPFWKPSVPPQAIFNNEPLPYKTASLWSKFLLNWAGPSIRVAWSRAIQANDLYDLTPDLQAQLGDQLEAAYHAHHQLASTSSWESEPDTSFLEVIYRVVRVYWWLIVALKLLGLILRAIVPLLMQDLLTQISRAYILNKTLTEGDNIENIKHPKSFSYMISIGVSMWIMLSVASSILYYSNWRSKLTGKLFNSALTSLISRKAMRLSSQSRLTMTDGRITTMVSVDASFIEAAIDQSNEIICTPAQIIWTMVILYWQLGYSAFVGISVICLTIPLKVVMFKYISKLRKAQNEVVDSRVKLVSEVLSNMRAVKVYTYEDWFGSQIRDMRQAELKRFLANNLVKSILTAIMSFIPTLAAVATFIVYAWLGHELDPAVIFSSLQYFNNLKAPIAYSPEVVSTLSQANAGIARIEEFLKTEEIQSQALIDPDAQFAVDVRGDFAVAGRDALSSHHAAVAKTSFFTKLKDRVQILLPSFGKAQHPHKVLSCGDGEVTGSSSHAFAVKNIDLQIARGSLVCIVGRVGTGKTALISGILNEIKQLNGHVRLGGKVGYAPQSAWIRSASILDNITFSTDIKNVDMDRLEETIDACGLRPDIEALTSGILTQVGERGVTLSGGQSQRLALASVVYSENDIVFLDDPLSAVDPHVANHIIEDCIVAGPLCERTRIIVTHHEGLLSQADHIIVMGTNQDGNGSIVQDGKYEDLVQKEGSFKSLINPAQIKKAPDDDSLTSSSDDHNDEEMGSKHKPGKHSETSEKLIMPEDISEGLVAYGVYQKYLSAIGSRVLAISVLVFLLLTQIAMSLNTLFLGYWSDNRFHDMTQNTYMSIYAGLGIAIGIFTWGAIFSISLAGMKASYTMFNSAWEGVIRSPISWHDRTPTGRIINRLSKDIEILDDKIAGQWHDVFSSLLTIVGSIIFVIWVYPWASLIFVPIIWYDYISTVFYLKISREIKRLVSILRSDIFINLGEQLSGLSVIRAMKRTDHFQRKFEKSTDLHMSATMISGFTQGFWLAHRISFMAQLSVLAVTICGIVFRKTIGPAELGVVLSYVILSTSILNRSVVYFVGAVVSMNTVERVQHYMDLPHEAPARLPTDPPTHLWPNRGEIVFKDVSMKYRPDLPLALRGIDFSVRPGEKVGVIGRTGSGKSSLIQALFRLVEISNQHVPYRDQDEDGFENEMRIGNGGSIWIDGLDISKLGLTTLRDGLSIIPQDAFLFSGTIRENIDPWNRFTDQELNETLRLISKYPKTSAGIREKLKLDYMVVGNGINLSAGERQLVALIRAMAKGSKILILDEATSSVDPQTDALIQEVIHDHLEGTTLISIAHRIQTVISHDKILVMDQGELVEIGSPKDLYEKPNSLFRKVCDRSNVIPDNGE
ncbi:uncharacterized protein I303_108574 [Kwoniella dejecticola CBS 10117]|uniref:P-loop containing nucleoside triphosphate hydrolase protein n=1 Tax=Kwoniella dejecticola CBS 10117 TaxID=1296121 RepID=A0AAJ8KWW9_9TREE